MQTSEAQGVADNVNVIFGEFGVTIVDALIHASLFRCILHIVFVRPEKEVGGIAADSIITVVADVQVIRDWTLSQHPRYAMGSAYLPVK